MIDHAIARNRGHFAPVINCQRNFIFKMADKDYRSQGKRIPYDILNNLSSVDLFYEEKGKKKTSSKKILGVYQAERLIARIHTAEKPAAWHNEEEILFLSLVPILFFVFCNSQESQIFCFIWCKQSYILWIFFLFSRVSTSIKTKPGMPIADFWKPRT